MIGKLKIDLEPKSEPLRDEGSTKRGGEGAA